MEALIPAVATIAAGMYLDARYSIRGDIEQYRAARGTQKFIQKLYKSQGEDDWSFYHVLHSTQGRNDNKEAFLFESRSWTYGQMREEIGRVALEFQRLGIKNRTVVSLFANNSPEFIFAWWALFKIGAIPAPINTAITGDYIKHCLRISKAEFLICTHELYGVSEKALFPASGSNETDFAHLQLLRLEKVVLYDYGTYEADSATLHEGVCLVKQTEILFRGPETSTFPKETRPKVGPEDAMEYLFTSGTTGLPKATTWPLGYALAGTGVSRYPNIYQKYRRFYICMPMFHGTAQFAAIPSTFASSGTVILARKFSRRNFWSDIRRSKANAFVYIGEMMRYLVQAPPDLEFPDEKKMHGVEVVFGLGLAPTIWSAFRDRFGIPWIAEYYSSSESTMTLVISNKNSLGVGKVARWGPLMRSFQKTFYIIRTDSETGEVLRDPKTGFCIKVLLGEVGESIVRIVPPIQRRHDYVGEGGEEATEKKVLRDVFAKGDEFFRLGDAMMMDSDGFISFQDRLGDTYRSKGHNISTTEVEEALMHHPAIVSANVYGIPMNMYGYDGQVGCAAITTAGRANNTGDSGGSDLLSNLEQWLQTQESALPVYAFPRFVRVVDESDARLLGENESKAVDGGQHVSLIMKKLKTDLRKEGFTLPATSKDRMYWIEKEGQGYVPLTQKAVDMLRSGKARL